jgi:hypothetical protein
MGKVDLAGRVAPTKRRRNKWMGHVFSVYRSGWRTDRQRTSGVELGTYRWPRSNIRSQPLANCRCYLPLRSHNFVLFSGARSLPKVSSSSIDLVLRGCFVCARTSWWLVSERRCSRVRTSRPIATTNRTEQVDTGRPRPPTSSWELCWWINLVSEKIRSLSFLFWTVWFRQFQNKNRIWVTLKIWRSKMFWSIKKVKKHQGIKIGENQARSQSYKNRTIRFVKPEYPIFSEQIESE